MNYSDNKQSFPAGNPLANALVVLVGALLIGFSLILGVVAFIAIGSIVLVMVAVVGIRVWWFKRRLRKAGVNVDGPAAPPGPTDGHFIEGEYRVVSRDSDDDQA